MSVDCAEMLLVAPGANAEATLLFLPKVELAEALLVVAIDAKNVDAY